MLRHYMRLRDHRHEVSVAFPARHDVPMQMVRDTGAGAFAEIHPQIDAAGIKCMANDLNGSAQRIIEIAKFVARQPGRITLVTFRSKQQVPVVVRVLVHHDDGVMGLSQNQRGPEIVLPILGAKNTAFVLGPLIDIGHPPRSPKLFHSSSPSSLGSYGFPSTRKRSSLPTLKKGTFLAATETSAPLLGLRPCRARRCLTTKLPKPRISIRSP